VLGILSFLRAGRAEERAKNAEHRAKRAERREEERHARDDQRFEREQGDERIAALERVAEHLREVQAAFDGGIGGDVTAIFARAVGSDSTEATHSVRGRAARLLGPRST
jgi:hypothetical protein